MIKQLTGDAAQCTKRILGARFRIISDSEQETGETGGGYWDKPERFGSDLPERLHAASTEKRAAIVKRVRELAAQGLNTNRMAKKTWLSRAAAMKYMDEAFGPDWAHYGVSYPSKLDPYADKVDPMLRAGRKFRELEDTIRQSGYDGASSTIRMYATRQRKCMKAADENAMQNTELIERKWVQKLLHQPVDKVIRNHRKPTGRNYTRISGDWPALRYSPLL